MKPILDREGETVAWRVRDVLYDRDGRAIGFIRNRAIYTREGGYRGRCENECYRDVGGAIVAFERDAGSTLPLPVPRPSPFPPKPDLRPDEPVFEPAPPAPMRRMTWSTTTWDELFAATPVG